MVVENYTDTFPGNRLIRDNGQTPTNYQAPSIKLQAPEKLQTPSLIAGREFC
jgi:hypothetical protein